MVISWTNFITQLRISEVMVDNQHSFQILYEGVLINDDALWVISADILGYRFLCLCLWLWLWYWDPVEASKKLLIPFCTLYRRFDPTLIAESKFFHAWNYSIQYLEWMDQNRVIPKSQFNGKTVFEVYHHKYGILSQDNRRSWWIVFILCTQQIIIQFPAVNRNSIARKQHICSQNTK